MASSNISHQWNTTLHRIAQNDPTLKWVDAMCFLLGDDGICRLAAALRPLRLLRHTRNTFVTKLNLRLNHIGADGVEGVRALADALLDDVDGVDDVDDVDGANGANGACGTSPWNGFHGRDVHLSREGRIGGGSRGSRGTLRELNLADNELGDWGALEIARLLGGNRSLTKLSLFRCQITHVGIKAIAKSLRKNFTLKWLNIAGNANSDGGECMDGVDEMIATLRQNPTLTHLQIDSDIDRSSCIENLISLNCKIESWRKEFHALQHSKLEEDDGERRGDGAKHDFVTLLCPLAWSKFSQFDCTLSIVFEMVLSCPSVFVHVGTTS